MKKLLTAFFVLASFSLPAQTLFYYGNDSVTVKEFLKAYQKNNTGTRSEKAFREYLDLYTASRLKIKEAKTERYDTLPQIAADLDNLRHQIAPAYLNDKEALNKLVDEAFLRSQKNIRVAHIFIKATTADAANSLVQKKLNDVGAEIRKSERGLREFSDIAKEYSDDPSAKTNGGDLGWLTVFSLPYELENLVYRTPVGKIGFHRSKAGYHYFKNLGERTDPGKIKAAQILLAFPPEANEEYKADVKKLADSIYNRLQKGDDFGKLASQLSNDVISAANNGVMQDFGVGQYGASFENVVFALAADGATSKPFLTSHGYHIVKRISRTPATATKTEKIMAALKEKVETSDRIATIKAALIQKIKKEANYKSLVGNNTLSELFLYSDSVLTGKQNGMTYTIDRSTPLIQIGNEKFDVANWITYAQPNRYKSNGSGVKSYPEVWDEYVDASAVHYYEEHLEDFNEEFKVQLTEFSEGNLFFEIMQRKVWGPAQTDTVALENYYNQHRNQYTWKQSADAVVFYATDVASAQTFIKELKKNPSNWNSLVAQYAEKIAADSSRMELSQIPNPSKAVLKAGSITNPLVNKMDKTASFAYVIRTYSKPETRSFAEARGLVINDYQNQLEKDWLAELKKKYPVRVSQKVLDDLVTSKKY